MQRFKKIAILVSMLIAPILSLAAPIVPCTDDCQYGAFLTLIHNFVQFVLFKLAVPIAAIMFAYAGFLMVTAGGEAASARTKAKTIFTNAVIGLALAAGAWLIITTILTILGFKYTGEFFS